MQLSRLFLKNYLFYIKEIPPNCQEQIQNSILNIQPP
jgi:hypothetical protein